MNLKHYLLLRIVLIAVIGLLLTAALVLYQASQQSQQQALLTAESLDKQLELQLFRIDADFGQAARFPDFDLWKESTNGSGMCVRFLGVDGKQQRGVCKGANIAAPTWPDWFGAVYQWAFNASYDVQQTVAYKGVVKGSLVVTPSYELAIANAWQSFRGLMGLSLSTTLAFCVLVSITLKRALAPAQVIVSGLHKMQSGDLSHRLPAFELLEWQQTSTAINELAASQAQLLTERKQLVLQLMTLQEEERRYLARELHDEFGQCLAAINAIAASITHTASTTCPSLVPESENISRISQHILTLLRGLLLRLRPSDIDELGLAVSLQSLVNDWNARSVGKTMYTLSVQGSLDVLSEALAINLLRMVQECLTNIAKHAEAKRVTIQLTVAVTNEVTLIIEDDGMRTQLPFLKNKGIGLIGIRERLDALDGQLSLAIAKPSGLIVQISIPVEPLKVAHS